MKKLLLIAALMLLMVGCTDAERASFGAYGEEAAITCYSGGEVVFEDVSTGKVLAAEGLIYRSKTTGRYVRAFGDCIAVDTGK